MKWFKDGTKGICPECGNEIEDVNDKFCSYCGWKISGMKAINARTEKEKGLKSSGDIKEISDNKLKTILNNIHLAYLQFLSSFLLIHLLS